MDRRRFLHLTSASAVGATWAPNTAAQVTQPMRDVVVLVPGITGSVLRKDGKDLCAYFGTA